MLTMSRSCSGSSLGSASLGSASPMWVNKFDDDKFPLLKDSGVLGGVFDDFDHFGNAVYGDGDDAAAALIDGLGDDMFGADTMEMMSGPIPRSVSGGSSCAPDSGATKLPLPKATQSFGELGAVPSVVTGPPQHRHRTRSHGQQRSRDDHLDEFTAAMSIPGSDIFVVRVPSADPAAPPPQKTPVKARKSKGKGSSTSQGKGSSTKKVKKTKTVKTTSSNDDEDVSYPTDGELFHVLREMGEQRIVGKESFYVPQVRIAATQHRVQLARELRKIRREQLVKNRRRWKDDKEAEGHYPERKAAAKARKRVGGKFQSENKGVFRSATEVQGC